MDCYECSTRGGAEPAVAVCRSCSAGLCLVHLRETASEMRNGSVMPTCSHDTWIPRSRA
ncbi:MAG: DUF2180 family protein [Thermoleophilaceae bacterium]|nr:DUF2180 family protein [Thermoleophilaceae bacterium]